MFIIHIIIIIYRYYKMLRLFLNGFEIGTLFENICCFVFPDIPLSKDRRISNSSNKILTFLRSHQLPGPMQRRLNKPAKDRSSRLFFL
jgi:hypothetical protein